MKSSLRLRFWLETVCATIGSGLGVVTLLWPTWIEGFSGVDPDHGSGATEWLVVAAMVSVAVASAVLAKREWSRSALA